MSTEDSFLPTIVLEVSGGLIRCIRSDAPVHIVILDDDTEGGDPAQIKEVDGEDVYVAEYLITEETEPGMDGIDPEYVENVINQI